MALVEAIKNVGSCETLSQYLREGLGYRISDVAYEARQLNIPPKPSESICSIHLLSDYNKSFQIYLLETTSLTRTTLRSILEPFYRHHPAGDYLFIFTKDYDQLAFVSPLRILRPGKPIPMLQLRILPVEPDNVYHTDLEVLEGISLTRNEQHPETIWKKHEQAFSVERVTDEFFKTYKGILGELEKTLIGQGKGNAEQAHAFAQQLLNRLMFLYFLQRKGWLKWGDERPDRRYMRTLWQKYRATKSSDGSFYRLWLTSLFFYAFNKRLSLIPFELPGDIRASLLNMPFLNGGLFVEGHLDRLGFNIPDSMFVALFDRNIDGTLPGFLERYNFTIQESLPLEVEVAVDPEMLGKVYESLINEEDRHQAGIFYTPRIEIDYMCRLSLIEYLHEATALSKDMLIPIVMALAAEDGRRELSKLGREDLIRLRAALDSVRVVDPAVGSGSFLVGMMNVIVQLYRAIAEQQDHHENEFALKKRIISQNLYGVDVKDWAVRVCELRLWLSLIIESEESQMDIYNQPLLPNLTFKARQGDSLLEEIAGIPLSLRADYAHIPSSLKQHIQSIVDKKADYFRGDRSVSRHDIEYLEHELLRGVVDNKIKAIDSDIRKLEARSAETFRDALASVRDHPAFAQVVLDAQEKERHQVEEQLQPLKSEKERLQKVAATVGKKGEKDYFLWDIDFAEVFLEKGGFDICIGNPPYVRQEEIAPPLLKAENYDPDEWREIKRGYKEQLERAVRAHWGSAITKIDKKSDLYVYFYYQGLNLLRPGGIFCFINSNSWLDVGYGGSLQQFLLKNIAIQQVIDNHARRSFKESDVNTVIVLLRRPKDGNWEALKTNIPKFIAYRVPFEAGANTENILLQEWSDSVQSVAEFRVYPIKQEELWLDGLGLPDEAEVASLDIGVEHGKYAGSKWGGKYLRAPDIFFTILEKGKGKLVRLGDIARVRRGFTTGANEFFYLEPTGKPAPKGLLHVRNGAGWEGLIEGEFLKPVLRSPKEVATILLWHQDLRLRLLICDREGHALKGTHVLEYIKWGEAKGYDERPTCRARSKWWSLRKQDISKLACNYLVNDLMRFYYAPEGIYFSDDFQVIRAKEEEEIIWAIGNSHLSALFLNLYGRTMFGGGLLKIQTYEVSNMLFLNPLLLAKDFSFLGLGIWQVKSLFEGLGINMELSNIRLEDVSLDKVLPDRRELDKVVFEALGLTESEQLEVYRAVVSLVKNRLVKAGSL